MSEVEVERDLLPVGVGRARDVVVEPTRPSSSAPQKAKRTALVTGGAPPRCTAVSSSAAVPDPLSLIPGPAGTESRCAPAITTWSGLPVVVWATTLRLRRSSVVAASTRFTATPPGAGQRVAVGLAQARRRHGAGDVAEGAWSSGPSTLFATSTAAACAAAAFVAFAPNGHVPRRMSTTAPAGTVAKSAGSHPDVPSCASTAERRGDAPGRCGGGVPERRHRRGGPVDGEAHVLHGDTNAR